MWPDQRVLDLLQLEIPIVQAPMAGPVLSDMVIAVSEAGGLGSLPCALLDAAQLGEQLRLIRAGTSRPVNLNFFSHGAPTPDPAREMAWRRRLERYAIELGLDPKAPFTPSNRTPFDAELCTRVEEFKPAVVSFHFGLPAPELVARVKACGAKIVSSATTVDEARWLEDHGCDAIIAQGFEAGGHRGNFLSTDVSTQVGTIALVPQVVDAVGVPVIAAGGITDARGIAAAFALGAAAVQLGTAYLFCPEAKLSLPQRTLLESSTDSTTTLTNVFTGRAARGVVNRLIREVGPISELAPAFPLAGGPVAPLRTKAEAQGSTDFTLQWAGQAAKLGRALPAGELTRRFSEEAQALLRKLGGA